MESGTKRRRREAAPGAEGNVGDETYMQQPKRHAVRFLCPLQKKWFSFRVTFRIPVVRGKNLDIGLAHSRRGEAGSGGGARVDVPLVLMLIQVGKEPPS